MGGQVGKSGNTGGNIITYDGLINENYFKTTPETTKTNSIEFSHCQTLNPFTKKPETFLGLILKSKYDGIGIKEPIDISIALDISGSMAGAIIINSKSEKNRLDIAIEACKKLIENLDESVNLCLYAFDDKIEKIFDLSTKKDLIPKLPLLNELKPRGGTKLDLALKHGIETLENSTNKNKRIILISDDWFQFNETIKAISKNAEEKNIGITFLAISEEANSNLADFSTSFYNDNYYLIRNDDDIEKYLINQFKFINFAYSYDIKLDIVNDGNENNFKIEKIIGTGYDKDFNKDNNTNIFNIKNAFPSDLKSGFQEGGLILLKYRSTNEKEEVNFSFRFSYRERNNEIKNELLNYKVKKLNDDNIFFSDENIKKGVSIFYYGKFLRKIVKVKNKDIIYTQSGPMTEEKKMDEKKAEKYNKNKKFLERQSENYDKIVKFFNNNYNDDVNQKQKEKYLDELKKKYDDYLDFMNKINSNENVTKL